MRYATSFAGLAALLAAIPAGLPAQGIEAGGAPAGMTNLPVRRAFEVVLAGTGAPRAITYTGEPVSVEF